MNFDEILNSVNEKLGEETFSTISDDIANLMSYNEAMENDIKAKDEKIDKLTKKADMLVEANGNLLQKVSAGIKEERKEETKEEPKKIDIRTAFDKDGNFIR